MPNAVHHTIATLAKAGCVAAIVTTNFDLCMETALANANVEHRVLKSQADVVPEEIAAAASDDTAPCYLLKVHGSADAAATVVDTLSQRAVGLAGPITDALRMLLEFGHWLVLGYSGADLAAAPNYLGLRPWKDSAQGFTWLVRQGCAPLEAVAQLAEAYGPRGRLAYGELPDFLAPLHAIGEEALQQQQQQQHQQHQPAAAVDTNDAAPAAVAGAGPGGKGKLEDRVQAWAAQLLPGEAVVALVDVLKAAQNYRLGATLLEAHLAALPAPAIDGAVTDTSVLRDVVCYCTLQTALAGIKSKLGDQDEARALIESALGVLSTADPVSLAPAVAAGAGVQDLSQLMIEDIAAAAATTVRGIEALAVARRELAEVVRTSAKEAGSFARAATLFGEAVQAFALLPGDARLRRGMAISRMGQGDVLRAQLDASDAAQASTCLAFYDEVLALAAEINDLPLQALALKNQGIVLKARAAATGDKAIIEQAFCRYKDALAVSGRVGDGVEQVKALRGLAGLYEEESRHAEALDFAQQSLALAAKVGYRAGEARALRVLSDVLAAKVWVGWGDGRESVMVGMKQGRHWPGGDRLDPFLSLQCQDELDDARKKLEASLAITDELGDQSGVARGKFSLAKVGSHGGGASVCSGGAVLASFFEG